jgi:hypothetical protein
LRLCNTGHKVSGPEVRLSHVHRDKWVGRGDGLSMSAIRNCRATASFAGMLRMPINQNDIEIFQIYLV